MATLRNKSNDDIGTDNGEGRMVSCGPDETVTVTDERAWEVADDDRYWTVVEANPRPVESAPEVPAAEPTPPAEPPAAPAEPAPAA